MADEISCGEEKQQHRKDKQQARSISEIREKLPHAVPHKPVNGDRQESEIGEIRQVYPIVICANNRQGIVEAMPIISVTYIQKSDNCTDEGCDE